MGQHPQDLASILVVPRKNSGLQQADHTQQWMSSDTNLS